MDARDVGASTVVEVRALSKRYGAEGRKHDGSVTQALDRVSFAVACGEFTGIMGPSGSGKSTVAKLMAGFWDATDGRVAFDGVDVRNIPYQQLMEHISYVAQDTFLFDRTLADNIRMGRPAARRVATSSSAACRRATTRAPARRARG